jgi:hypothetical protein
MKNSSRKLFSSKFALVILAFVSVMFIMDSCAPKRACGNKRQHHQRTRKIKKMTNMGGFVPLEIHPIR